MFLPNISALAVVCWIMCVRITMSQASLPAPTFKFGSGVNAMNIELNTLVGVSCYIPRGASYPVTVSVGRLESPSQTPETTEAWVTTEVIHSSKTMDFTIPAVAKFEGKIVCWYQSTRTELKNPYSEFSSPLTLVVSALRAPKVSLHPSLFRVGGNYTVYCNSTSGPVTNFTLSLYYRSLPVTPGTNWTFAGSVFLTHSDNIFISNTNAVVPIEFICDMEMLYNGKVLSSPKSNIEKAIPEELPVRLWEQTSGESCLGYLDVKFRGNWQPVCQKEVTEADASAAIATAKVVCKELGCGRVLEWKRVLDYERNSFTLGGIRCSGKEEKTKDCPMGEIESCRERGFLYIVCSDALPLPKLSVMNYGPVSKVYVKEKQNVQISCSVDSTYLKGHYGDFIFKKDGAVLRRMYMSPISSVSITESDKVDGKYECVYQLDSSKIKPVSQPSNSVFIYVYIPPDPVPIVAGVLTTVIGIAIMTYICVCRRAEEEVQGNEFPAHSQDPATNTENPDHNVYIPQQM
ncbi:uncharacterized protein si:dkey-195m11.11 isoform X1 [Megalobrama amblycephala]|uniref:uncharacterized protein si:dkey-195m11.11 isoform X1 n=2 Tax=Megalobrama amblycephala TaxID=75352 RepID=UPI002014407F|nr:uncharacterized protein si:dkey-195m11.11 isoform X1 [Megalobrama amblycephala]